MVLTPPEGISDHKALFSSIQLELPEFARIPGYKLDDLKPENWTELNDQIGILAGPSGLFGLEVPSSTLKTVHVNFVESLDKCLAAALARVLAPYFMHRKRLRPAQTAQSSSSIPPMAQLIIPDGDVPRSVILDKLRNARDYLRLHYPIAIESDPGFEDMIKAIVRGNLPTLAKLIAVFQAKSWRSFLDTANTRDLPSIYRFFARMENKNAPTSGGLSTLAMIIDGKDVTDPRKIANEIVAFNIKKHIPPSLNLHISHSTKYRKVGGTPSEASNL